jgi:hypothetical protein
LLGWKRTSATDSILPKLTAWSQGVIPKTGKHPTRSAREILVVLPPRVQLFTLGKQT